MAVSMNGQQIFLKTVDGLRVDPQSNVSLNFVIPAYQRGYQWLVLHVTQLLEDIREFTQRQNPLPKEFYCLQPLVIKMRLNGDFEVIKSALLKRTKVIWFELAGAIRSKLVNKCRQ